MPASERIIPKKVVHHGRHGNSRGLCADKEWQPSPQRRSRRLFPCESGHQPVSFFSDQSSILGVWMSYLPEPGLGDTFEPFVFFRENFGFVPNLFRAQALLPRVIKAETRTA